MNSAFSIGCSSNDLVTRLLKGMTHLDRDCSCQYQRWKARDQSIMQPLRNADKLVKQLTTDSPDTLVATQARQEFNLALNDLKNLKSSVEQIPSVASNLPNYDNLLLA